MAARNDKKPSPVAAAIRRGGFKVKLSDKILDLLSNRKGKGK
jgi:hypothetical protein